MTWLLVVLFLVCVACAIQAAMDQASYNKMHPLERLAHNRYALKIDPYLGACLTARERAIVGWPLSREEKIALGYLTHDDLDGPELPGVPQPKPPVKGGRPDRWLSQP